jgi:hypothetical protein
MQVNDLIEVLCAAHLTSRVGSPFVERGGLMLVGPPGVMKTTFLSVLETQYHDVVTMSDVNAQSLATLRDAIASEQIRTLVLPELGKLYERAQHTSSNVEGVLRAMVAEGFQAASFQDQRVNRLKARVLVMGAMTPKTQGDHFTDWEDSGFNRRFLWVLIRLEHPDMLEQAVVNDRLIQFWQGPAPRPPVDSKQRIPILTTAAERHAMRMWVKYQPGGSHTSHLQLLSKIVSVLRWWYKQTGDKRNAMDTVHRFSEALGREGASIEIPPEVESVIHLGVKRSKQKRVTAAARLLAKQGSKKGRRK